MFLFSENGFDLSHQKSGTSHEHKGVLGAGGEGFGEGLVEQGFVAQVGGELFLQVTGGKTTRGVDGAEVKVFDYLYQVREHGGDVFGLSGSKDEGRFAVRELAFEGAY